MVNRPKRPALDKSNLWPWRDWMTIGIGVLATSEAGRTNRLRPDTAVLIADTMGSYGDVDSHQRLHKVIMMPDERLYATVAGDVTNGAELMPVIASFVREIPAGQRSYGRLQKAIAKGCFTYKSEKFTLLGLPRLRLAPEVFDPRNISSELNATIQAAWKEFSIECDLIIAAFDDSGMAYLFEMCGADHTLKTHSLPGFAAIGTGFENAIFWLSRREQTHGVLPLRAAYHAYEAKLMAESSAHVNEHLDILVATKDEHWFCTTHRSLHGEKEHSEINVLNLKRLYRKYGCRKTDGIGAKNS